MLLNAKAVAASLGILLLFLGVALVFPMVIGIAYAEPEWWSFGVCAALAFAVGGAAWKTLGGLPGDLGIREGFAIVALAWVVLSLVGSLPFVLGGVFDSYTDAFFETMSGFTTTGATVLGGGDNPNIEEIPHSFLFWRSLTHWIGGMGIIVLTLAILPILGVGGMQLFKAEVPGPAADKLTPRVRETAKRLWYIYVGLTAAQTLLLLPVMSWFDAINHAFATMATGGFSTRNGSVADFASAYIDWVIVIFMFLAGVNFALHYRMLRGKAITVFRDTELQVYAAITVTATALVTIGIWEPVVGVVPHADREAAAYAAYSDITEALRYGAFQVVSIVTTTGFGTADYEVWPPLAIGVIFLLFFCGGMAGSTGGGVKVVRHVLMFKNSFREIKQLVHPNAVIHVRLNGEVVPQEILSKVLSFIVLYIGGIGIGTFALALAGLDLLGAFGATMSSIGNIGPAFGTLGPTENYAHVPSPGKWMLSFLMMAGRLELFTVLILLAPAFWRR